MLYTTRPNYQIQRPAFWREKRGLRQGKPARGQAEGKEFQRKVQNNAFVSRERAEQENARLVKKQQDLQELQSRLTNELQAENQKNSLQLRDSINSFLKIITIYNKSSRR